MTAIALDLLSAALALPEEDRLDLATRLLDSVHGKAEEGRDDTVSAEIRAELDRRLESIERDGPVGVDWEDVNAEMMASES